MRQSMRGGLVFLLLVGVLGVLQPAWAQEVTSGIVGTITDPSGAPIKDATVTVSDTERGIVRTAKTNDSGAYNITRLAPGTYQLKVTATGFQTSVHQAFTLVLNQTARVDTQMQVGQVSETVEVTGTAPVLQSQTTEVGTVIDARTSDALPLATRNYVQLTLLTPGVITVDPQSMNKGSNTAEEGGRPYINGNREQSNNFLLDGVDNNQVSDNLLAFTPSPDAIAEFNLITQNASAEFGNYNGGIVNVTIKSGTNKFHGDVFEFFRNDMFNANKWENGLQANTPTGVLPTPKVRWNMFGGTLGGPIIKNKLFFFADYQAGRLDFPSTSSFISVLSPAETTGDFSALSALGVQLYNPCAPGTGGTSGTTCSILAPGARTPFAGNIIPANMLNPAFTALVTSPLYPQAAFTSGTTGFGQAVNTTAQRFNSDQGDIKVDFNASNNDHFFGRYSKGNQYDPSSNSQPLLGSTVNEAYLQNGALNWTHSFSSSMTNEARFGVNYVKLPTGITTFDSSVGALGNRIGIANGNPPGIDGLPLLGFAGGTITNIPGGTLRSLGAAVVIQKFSTTVTQFDDILIFTHGRHVIKAGYQMNKYNINAFYSGNAGELGAMLFGNGPNGNYSGNGAGGGDPAADWALGIPEDAGRGASSGGWHQRDWLFAGFAQDDWRITDTLTLNLGLRYETRTPWVETHNRQVGVNIATGALEFPGNTPVPAGVVGSNGFSRGLYKADYGLLDFQPRIGFAWSPSALNGKTVIRGAFTISSYLEGTGNNLRLTQNPPFTPPQVEANNVATGTGYSTETGFSSATSPTGNPFIGATMLAWNGTVQPAVADQWNLAVQHQLANNTTIQLGYVGQRTTHLMVPEWLAQGDLQPNGTITYPLIGGKNDPASGLTGFGPNQFGNVKNTASVGNMNYNAMQVVLQKRYGHGLEGQIAYTFQKCMTNDDGYYGTWGTATQAGPSGNYWQNLYNPNGDYARCYWDTTHVLSAYAVYELPIGRGKALGRDLPTAVNAVVGNWSINPIVSWHTGFPLSLYGSDTSGTGSPENRPNCNGPVRYPKTVTDQGIQWFSPSSFSDAPAGSFGNCPAQGPVIGPGYVAADISLQKNFPITESMRVQFRADFLNAFNHPNFGVPNDSCCSGTFGISSTSQDARQLQFDLKFYF
jgi:Carboxypeptidase regulatory-like domain